MKPEEDLKFSGDEKTEAIDLADIKDIKKEAYEKEKTQEKKMEHKKKKTWKEKIGLEQTQEQDGVKVIITRFQAKRALIKTILWAIAALLSIAFGVTAIVHGVQNFDNIRDAFNNNQNWKGTVKILSSLASFLEAGLFIFFIFYSTVKSIFYFGPYRTWQKQSPKNKKLLKKQAKNRKYKAKQLKKVDKKQD